MINWYLHEEMIFLLKTYSFTKPIIFTVDNYSSADVMESKHVKKTELCLVPERFYSIANPRRFFLMFYNSIILVSPVSLVCLKELR